MLTTARCTMSMVEPGALMFPATELADLSDSTGIVQPRSGGLLACCPALLLAIRLFTISQYFPSYFPSFLPSHDSPVRRHRRLLIWRLACWLAAAGLLGSGDAFHSTITVVQSVIVCYHLLPLRRQQPHSVRSAVRIRLRRPRTHHTTPHAD